MTTSSKLGKYFVSGNTNWEWVVGYALGTCFAPSPCCRLRAIFQAWTRPRLLQRLLYLCVWPTHSRQQLFLQDNTDRQFLPLQKAHIAACWFRQRDASAWLLSWRLASRASCLLLHMRPGSRACLRDRNHQFPTRVLRNFVGSSRDNTTSLEENSPYYRSQRFWRVSRVRRRIRDMLTRRHVR